MGWYAVMLIILAVVIYSEENKKYKASKKVGDKGESIVAKRLAELDDSYVVEHDVHFGQVQIDHLVINHELKIVFVIETKLWGRILDCNKENDYWQLESGKYVRNPFKQNNYHCKVVRRYYGGYSVHSIIVFVRDNGISGRSVVRVSGLVEYIYRTSRNVSNSGKIGL
ncbi:MAG: Nuclease-related domain [Anaerocolumna sp.]|jgi:hypothetical protein|nr:Nuclease-related domain [Anaerocolumna sp.]